MRVHSLVWIGILLLPSVASAKAVHFGLGIGANLGSTTRNTPQTNASGDIEQVAIESSGMGGAAGAQISLFQDNWSGVRLSYDWIRFNTKGTQGDRLLGNAHIFSGTLTFNFDLTKSRTVRLSTGAGYGSASYYKVDVASFGGRSFSSSDGGVLLEAKFLITVKKTRYIFLDAKYFVMNNLNPKFTPMTFLLGFDI